MPKRTKKKFDKSKYDDNSVKSAFRLWKSIQVNVDIKNHKSINTIVDNIQKRIRKLNILDNNISNNLKKCSNVKNLFLVEIIKIFENYEIEEDNNNEDSLEKLSELLYLLCLHRSEYIKYNKYLESFKNFKDSNNFNLTDIYKIPKW